MKQNNSIYHMPVLSDEQKSFFSYDRQSYEITKMFTLAGLKAGRIEQEKKDLSRLIEEKKYHLVVPMWEAFREYEHKLYNDIKMVKKGMDLCLINC